MSDLDPPFLRRSRAVWEELSLDAFAHADDVLAFLQDDDSHYSEDSSGWKDDHLPPVEFEDDYWRAIWYAASDHKFDIGTAIEHIGAVRWYRERLRSFNFHYFSSLSDFNWFFDDQSDDFWDPPVQRVHHSSKQIELMKIANWTRAEEKASLEDVLSPRMWIRKGKTLILSLIDDMPIISCCYERQGWENFKVEDFEDLAARAEGCASLLYGFFRIDGIVSFIDFVTRVHRELSGKALAPRVLELIEKRFGDFLPEFRAAQTAGSPIGRDPTTGEEFIVMNESMGNIFTTLEKLSGAKRHRFALQVHELFKFVMVFPFMEFVVLDHLPEFFQRGLAAIAYSRRVDKNAYVMGLMNDFVDFVKCVGRYLSTGDPKHLESELTPVMKKFTELQTKLSTVPIKKFSSTSAERIYLAKMIDEAEDLMKEADIMVKAREGNPGMLIHLHKEVLEYCTLAISQLDASVGRIPTWAIGLVGSSGIGKTTKLLPYITDICMNILGEDGEGGHIYAVPRGAVHHEGIRASSIGMIMDDPAPQTNYPPGMNPFDLLHQACGGEAIQPQMAFDRKGMQVDLAFAVIMGNEQDLGTGRVNYARKFSLLRRINRWFVTSKGIAPMANGSEAIHVLKPEDVVRNYVFQRIVPIAEHGTNIDGTYEDMLSQEYDINGFLREVIKDFRAHRASGKKLLDRRRGITYCDLCELPHDLHIGGTCPGTLQGMTYCACEEFICSGCTGWRSQHFKRGDGLVCKNPNPPIIDCTCGQPRDRHWTTRTAKMMLSEENVVVKEDYFERPLVFQEADLQAREAEVKQRGAVEKKAKPPVYVSQALILPEGPTWWLHACLFSLAILVACSPFISTWILVLSAIAVGKLFSTLSELGLNDLPPKVLTEIIVWRIWFHSCLGSVWHRHYGHVVHRLILQEARKDLTRLKALQFYQNLIGSPWFKIVAAVVGSTVALLVLKTLLHDKYGAQSDVTSEPLMTRKQNPSSPFAQITTVAQLEGTDYILEPAEKKKTTALTPEFFRKRLASQTRRFKVMWEDTVVAKSFAIAVCGNLCATVAHNFPSWCVHFELVFEEKTLFGFSESGRFKFSRDMIYFEQGRDIAWFAWPLPVPQSLLENVLSLKELGTSAAGEYTSPRGEVTSGNYKLAKIHFDDNLGTIIGWMGPSVSLKGDCATPLILKFGDVEVLGGILCAGKTDKVPSEEGIFSVICRESVTAAYNALKNIGLPVSGPMSPDKYEFLSISEKVSVGPLSKDSYFFKVPGEYALQGCVEGTLSVPQGAKSNTMMFPTPFGESLGCHPERWTPASAARFKRLNPDGSSWWYTWKTKYLIDLSRPKAAFSPLAASLARKKMVAIFKRVIGNSPWQYITLDQAFRGVPGTPLGKLPISTSSGCVLFRGDKTPYSTPFPIPGDPDFVLLTEGIREACVRMVSRIRQGFHIAMLFTVIPKMNEVIKTSKAVDKPARPINNCNVVYNLLLRKYASPVVSRLSTPVLQWGGAIGMNALSSDWGCLRDRIAVGKAGVRTKFCDADVKGMDFTLTSWDRWRYFFSVILEVVNETYDPLEYLILFQLCVCACWFFISLNGDVVAMMSCLPSGIYLTAIENTVISLFFLLYAYYESAVRAGLLEIEMPDPEEVLGWGLFGDDSIFGVDDSITGWFTPQSYQQTLGDAGVIITFGSDKDAAPRWKALEETTFLKRGFRFEDGVWWAPLEIESIEKMLSWYQPTKAIPQSEHFAVILENAGREFFVHGRAEYEKRLPGLIAAGAQQQCRALSALKSFDEMKLDFLSGKFHAW